MSNLPSIASIQVATVPLPAYLARSAAVLAGAGGVNPPPEINFMQATVILGDGAVSGSGAQVPAISTLQSSGAVTHQVWSGKIVQSVSVDAANSAQVDILCVVPAVDGSGNEIGPFYVTEYVITDELGAAMLAGTTLMPKLVTANGAASDLSFVASVGLTLGTVVVAAPSAAFASMAQVQAAFNANLPTAAAPLVESDTTSPTGWVDRTFGLTGTWAGTFGGTANALTAALSPAPAALAAGMEVAGIFSAANTGPLTIAVAGFGAVPANRPDSFPFTGGECVAGLRGGFVYNGSSFDMVTPLPRRGWDAASPPASPILLSPGQTASITFAGVASLPLGVASRDGQVYRIALLISATANASSNWLLLPNDTTYSNAFSTFETGPSDSALTGLGSAAAPNVFTTFTSAVTAQVTAGANTYVGGVAEALMRTDSNFFIDCFIGPSAADAVLGRGPAIMEMLLTTATSAKTLLYNSGQAGGSLVGFDVWNDSTTLWTSLGTLSASGAPMTGVVLIERVL